MSDGRSRSGCPTPPARRSWPRRISSTGPPGRRRRPIGPPTACIRRLPGMAPSPTCGWRRWRCEDAEERVIDALRRDLADRYTLERELGRGGMADVFLATDLRYQRRVALKVLRAEVAQAIGRERFQREIATAARLQHPHILPLFDSGEAGGLLYYVMPLIEGESLRARLSRETQLPIADAVGIAREVAEALAYAHSRGVVHRDVKPENILLESGHALLADFGVASAIGGETRRLTDSGIAVGTPTYMSPEQGAAERQLDGRSDIYSLGCVLYEMLAGEPPFTGPTVQAIVARRFTGDIPRLSTVRPATPQAVEDAVTRALALVPADRWPTRSEEHTSELQSHVNLVCR